MIGSDSPLFGNSAHASRQHAGFGQLILFLVSAFLISGLQAPFASLAVAGDEQVPAGENAAGENETTGEKLSAAPEREYVRIRRNDRKLSVALETSVIHFADSKRYPNAAVDLIGAIHLGEPEYYEQLNELFKTYDVLLFEAVMPEEAVRRDLRPGGGDGSRRRGLNDEQQWTEAKVGLAAISVLQLGMKDALGMEFQLSGIDYTAKNFVHADMTAEEFEASMASRGESFSGMFLMEMSKSVANQQENNPLAINLDVMLSMLTSDRLYRVRRIAAVQLAKSGNGDAFAGFDGTSTIITERNRKCLEVMDRELQKGQQKVGIFYGAGHFSDMEKRMVEEYGFERKSEDWLIAWHLRSPEKSGDSSSKN
ncbi:MAG: hypothetical protein KDB01_16535 [Planctomycetaceae bacterium]|nr:hypothetical protein [Planctomycetaceae bacterium]